jgi:predicted transcriptional regulator
VRWLRRLFASLVRHEAVKVELPLPIPQRYRELWSYAEERVVRKLYANLRSELVRTGGE